MLAGENLRIAFRALWANKMRSILTALGIIIGVAAVIAVVSIVQGLQFVITQQFQGVGATYMIVLPNQQSQQGPGVVAKQVKLTWEDGQAVSEEVLRTVYGELALPIHSGCAMALPVLFRLMDPRGRHTTGALASGLRRYDVEDAMNAVYGVRMPGEENSSPGIFGCSIHCNALRPLQGLAGS